MTIKNHYIWGFTSIAMIFFAGQFFINQNSNQSSPSSSKTLFITQTKSTEQPQQSAVSPSQALSEPTSTNQQTKDKVYFIEQLDQATQITSFHQRAPLIKMLLAQWAKQDIQAVLSWLEQQPESHELGEYYSPIIQYYMQLDAYDAGELILTLPNFDAIPSIISHYVDYLVKIDVDSALAWVEDITEPFARQNATQQLLNTWARISPQDAILFLTENSQLEEHTRSAAMTTVANTLSRQSHDDTVTLLHQYPDDIQPKLAYSVISHWPITEADNAIDWIYTLDGALKDEAIHSYIDYFGVSEQPEISFNLSTNIANTELKSRLLHRVLIQWHQTEPNIATQELLSNVNLSDSEKQQLLAYVKQTFDKPNTPMTR